MIANETTFENGEASDCSSFFFLLLLLLLHHHRHPKARCGD
jgi:hypothetical protein